MPLLQLIYASVMSGTVKVDVDAMLAKSQENNARDEITGLLYCNDRCFLQALEGPKEAVEDCFLRIMRDDRHSDLRLLSRRLTGRREFGEWAMLRREFGQAHDAYIETIKARCQNADPAVLTIFTNHLLHHQPFATGDWPRTPPG